MIIHRRGASTVVIAGVLVAVVAVGGVGYFLYSSGLKSGTNSGTTSQSSTAGTTTPLGSIRVVMELLPSVPLVSSDVVANFTLDVTVIGSASSPLTVGVTPLAGVTVQPSPVQIQPGTESTKVSMSFRVQDSVVPGTYPLNISVSSAGQTYSQKFSLEVVKYLVVTVGTNYVPSKLNVPVGSTVNWMRVNGAIDQYDNGDHNVKFNSIAAASPTMGQYQSWSYTFGQAGTYSYYCTFHPFMTGEITVA